MLRMMRLVAVALLLAGPAICRAAEPQPVPVLDMQEGSFRAFMAWRTGALVGADGKLKPVLEPVVRGVEEDARRPMPIMASDPPPADWAAPDFDDTDWMRVRGSLAVLSDEGWDRIWLRGAFNVDDPKKAPALTLTLRYTGGVVVYVNGQELTRAHLPAGEIGPRTFAEGYPAPAYLRPNGKIYGRRDGGEFAERMGVRYRTAGKDGLGIPANMLRAGVNVIAVQCVGAALSEKASQAPHTDQGRYRLPMWPHAGVATLRLTADSADGLSANVGPTAEVSIGNVPPGATVLTWDYVPTADALRPVRITAARNGEFSGRVVLSSSQAIGGLKATPGDLSAEGGARIPASAVRIRWSAAVDAGACHLPENRFDTLLDAPPSQVAPSQVKLRGQKWQPPATAVVPVWITVGVPADAAAGVYRGNVTVEARAGKPARFTVPVEVRVFDWKVPDAADRFLLNNIHQSPDTIAKRYKVEPWSDEHLKLVGQSLDILKQLGNRVCILNLVVRAHGHGNEQSMVRWIRQPDGTYRYDFTLAEKYMDLFAKVVGEPEAVQVNVWMFGGDTPSKPKWPPEGVTVLDTRGNRLEDVQQPNYGTDENAEFWRPVLAELRTRLQKRGWWDATVLGWLDYARAPHDSIVDVALKIWPDREWYKNAHATSKVFGSSDKKASMPVRYSAWVWGAGGLYDPDIEQPWAKAPVFHPGGRKSYPRPWRAREGFTPMVIPRVGVLFTRPGIYDHSPLMRLRTAGEGMLQGGLCGMSMVGADFWPLPLGARGRLDVLCDGRGGVTPRNNTKALLAAGPSGPVFSERAEALRQGIHTAEAIVLLGRALDSGRLDDALAERVRLLLDERARQYQRNCPPTPGGPGYDATWMTLQATDWRGRDEKLFALAAEVSAKVGAAK